MLGDSRPRPGSAVGPLRLLAAAILATAGAAGCRDAAAPDACDSAACIEVGTLNIEWLGSRERNRDDVQAIADLLATELDLEVVSLQEIDTESEAWEWLAAALAPAGYRVVRGRSSTSNQFVVLLYDEDEVDLIPGTVRELEIPTEFEWPGQNCRVGGQRAPLAARFRAGDFDFWAVGLHLKSRSTRGGRIPAWCPDSVRLAQATALAAELRALAAASGEDDVLLIGDFNAFHDDPTLAPLFEAGFLSVVAPDRRGRGSGEASYVQGPRGLIDHVMVHPDSTREWVPGSGFVYPIASGRVDEYVDRISDHAPVWASFRIDLEPQEAASER